MSYDRRPRTPKRALAIVYPYVRCSVPGCLVRTKKPNEYGMCPAELWDLRHVAYYQRAKGAA